MKTMTNKELSEATFRRYQEQYLQEELKEIQTILFKKLHDAFESGAIPDHWKATGNRYLSKAIIHSFCKDEPYKGLTPEYIKEQNNLHKFI